MGEGDAERPTIETICPSCLARVQAYERPSMRGLVVTFIHEVGREPPKVTALLRAVETSELRGHGQGEDETSALLEALAKHEAKLAAEAVPA